MKVMPRRKAKSFKSWIERTVYLPLALAAEPGTIKLPANLREIAEATIDPLV